MRRRGRWGWLAPGGGPGLREVDGRVARRSIAVMSLAGWQIDARMARHVMRRASCPRCPRAASLFAGIGLPADSGRTARTYTAVPVPGSPGNHWRGVKDWRADRIPGWDSIRHMSCPAGGVWASAAAGRRLSSRARPGPGRQWGGEMQLDSAGLDG